MEFTDKPNQQNRLVGTPFNSKLTFCGESYFNGSIQFHVI